MHPGQFIAHFINTAIVTAIVAALVLWRYKVGVLAGMNTGGGGELLMPPPRPRPAVIGTDSAARAVAWERQTRRRVGVIVAVLVLICSLPLAYLAAASAGEVTPMHVFGQTGQFLPAAIPIAALLAAYSWREAVRYAVVLLAGGVALMLAVSALQRLSDGRAPTLDQAVNGLVFLQLTALNSVAPLLVMLATALPRVRGVAPMTFVGLLVFSLAPLGGSQLTRELATTATGGELVLNAGLTIGFVLLALPTGWVGPALHCPPRADAVLMDLRDFSRSRAGSAFELQQLARRIGAQRVVLAVDDSTDREFLTASFGGRTPRLLELPARDVADRDLERVFEAAIDAAYATDPPAQAALGASGS